MAFTHSTSGDEVVPQMNVTPLVDVVLVLLVTFMVIAPLLTRTFWIHTPEQRTEEVQSGRVDEDSSLVLRVERDGSIHVNGSTMTIEDLPARLRHFFAAREDHILFFDAADEVSFGTVMQILDRAREGDAITLGMLTQPPDGPLKEGTRSSSTGRGD